MDPLSKMFGQKGEGTSGSQESASRGSTEQAFGLQLIFESGESVIIPSLPVTIGRGDQNSVVLKDDTVSTTHARIYYDDLVRNICIVDTDSLNGLYINDQPTRKNILYDGAKIRLGKVVLTFRDTGYIHPG